MPWQPLLLLLSSRSEHCRRGCNVCMLLLLLGWLPTTACMLRVLRCLQLAPLLMENTGEMCVGWLQ